jgi:exodeoxyribonuclease VII small subunit
LAEELKMAKSGVKGSSGESFEGALEDLEKMVNQLESGELSLEESLEKFESGVKLYKDCKKMLSSAEKKITILSESLKEDELL